MPHTELEIQMILSVGLNRYAALVQALATDYMILIGPHYAIVAILGQLWTWRLGRLQRVVVVYLGRVLSDPFIPVVKAHRYWFSVWHFFGSPFGFLPFGRKPKSQIAAMCPKFVAVPAL